MVYRYSTIKMMHGPINLSLKLDFFQIDLLRFNPFSLSLSLSLYIYIYIYIYTHTHIYTFDPNIKYA